MGAEVFFTLAFGESPAEAFRRAVGEVEYRYGKAGFTGFIAEKDSFTVIPREEHKGYQKRTYAEELVHDGD